MKNKKKIITIIISLILILTITLTAMVFFKKNEPTEELIYSYNEMGVPKFIEGNFFKEKITNNKEALNSFNELKSQMRFKNVQEEFTLSSEEANDNITYYKFKQIYKNIHVLNHELILSVDKEGNILSLNGCYLPDIDVDVNPKLSKDQAEKFVLDSLGENAKIFASELNIIDLDNDIKLVYVIDAYSENEYKEFIVESNTGEILLSISLLENASFEYTGEGLKGKETISIEEYQEIMPFKIRYRFNDLNRNIEIKDGRTIGLNPVMQLVSGLFTPESLTGDIEDGVFKVSVGNNTKEDIVKEAITAMKIYEDIYDYYKKLGRNSYDNKGSKIIVHIGVGTASKEELNNAFWMSKLNQMFIGRTEDGTPLSVSKDILAHEFTHGVIGSTANFSKVPKNKNEPNETGALNEGISDIMGMLIEDKNWAIGEDSGWNLRDMSNPQETKDPNKKNGEYYFPYGYLNEERTLEDFLKDNNLKNLYSYDNGGIHHNATVVSHSAYLMYKNGAVKNKVELARLWYNSLFLMSSYSNFEDCAFSVIKTAKNMGMKESSIDKIKEAFYETNMLEKTKYKLNGIVTNEQKQVPNIKIELRNEQTKKLYTIKTNNKGEFEFKDLPRGKYIVEINDKKYELFKKTLEINYDIDENIILKSIKNIENNNGMTECYNYEIIDGKATITGRTKYTSPCTGDLIIPAKIDGYTVTTLGKYSFYNSGDLTSITIPETVEIIDDYAFLNCNFKSLTIPDSVISIGIQAFSNYSEKAGVLTDVKIGKNVKSIGNQAFAGNNISKLEIPDSVEIIKIKAFANNKIKELKLGNGLKIIENNAFTKNALTNLDLPNNLEIIDWSAFSSNNLEKVVIGQKVKKIGGSAFENGGGYSKATDIINKTDKSFDWEDILTLKEANCKNDACVLKNGTIDYSWFEKIDTPPYNIEHRDKLVIKQ